MGKRNIRRRLGGAHDFGWNAFSDKGSRFVRRGEDLGFDLLYVKVLCNIQEQMFMGCEKKILGHREDSGFKVEI